MVDEERAGRLEENSSRHRNCKRISSLLTVSAALVTDTLYSLLPRLTQRAQSVYALSALTQPERAERKWPGAKCIHCDAHAQCCRSAQLLYNHVFAKPGARVRGPGVREPDHSILVNLLFPSILPLQGLMPHNLGTNHLPQASLGD